MACFSSLNLHKSFAVSSNPKLHASPSFRPTTAKTIVHGSSGSSIKFHVNNNDSSSSSKAHVNGHDRVHLAPHVRDGAGLRVAFQGAPGAYSEFAAKTALPGCDTVPCRAFEGAVAAVLGGAADRAVLPVESTMEGTALRNYDLLLRHDVAVVQEISLFVHYCLLAMPGVRAAEVRRVISHPVALAHCGRALALLGVDREPVEDTAGAVEMLRSGGLLDTAAIASTRAADLYGLDVLAHGLQDVSWNVTRFLLLSKQPAPPPPERAGAKTSMVIAHRGGSMVMLLKVLSAFSSRGVNLTKLEVINNEGGNEGRAPVMILDTSGRESGHPTLRAFPHVLYVDCEGPAGDPLVRDAVEEIERFSVFVRVLGCYAADSYIYDLQ